MFVKLNFTADKNFVHIRQILNAIINDTAIDSVAALATAAASWNSAITVGIDYSTTEIIRTAEPSTVRSHLADNTNVATAVWTLEFQVYDAPTRKYYISFDTTALNSTLIRVGDTIASGDMGSDQSTMSVDLFVPANVSGTPVRLSTAAGVNTLSAATPTYMTSTPNNATNIRTFWMYLTNHCLIVAHTGTQSTNLGFPTVYETSANFTGPFIFSQYNRYDYHNSDANGIIPLMFSNITKNIGLAAASGAQTGLGFGMGALLIPDWARQESVQSPANSGITDAAFRVFNMVDAAPLIGPTPALLSFPNVNWGSGSRTNELLGLNTDPGTLNINTSGASQTGPLIFNTAGTRFASADLTTGHGMLPLRWSNSPFGNQGGNATDRGGFYIFNGDYFPGDTFVHSGKTYMIWPTWRGFAARVGIAVPKE